MTRLGRIFVGACVATVIACDDPVAQTSYSETELEYFGAVAFGTESSGDGPLRRWVHDVDLAIEGSPDAAHVQTIEEVVDELNELIASIEITILEPGSGTTPDVRMYVVPRETLVAMEPELSQGNDALFWMWWNGNDEIYQARAIVSNDVGSLALQRHWIREELTQLFGMGQDSWDYEESIFYAGYSETTEYAPIDRGVIRMVYDRRLVPGMPRGQALQILSGD